MPSLSEQHAKCTELRRVLSNGLLSDRDEKFATSLCDQFFSKGYISDKQFFWVKKLIDSAGGHSKEGRDPNDVEEIFDGTKITALLAAASANLKFPRLRFQEDGGSKIVFSYDSRAGSKWRGCTFIDNGAKAENKIRYGFISRDGRGKLNRESRQEIKTFIRKIATDPVETAKLSGQKYSNCCFCGLELINKSSVYHGYGPICAGNWGLPWGDTGDPADEEKAAAEEMKHIQLTDLE